MKSEDTPRSHPVHRHGTAPGYGTALPNLRHLEVFREVGRRGSLSAAARAAHLTQPAVTQAVARVEAFFGATLLARTAAGTTLEPAGTKCLPRVERALGRLRDALDDARHGRDRAAPKGREGATAREPSLRGITASQLTAFATVVEAGGFGAAARQVGAARPTLHRAARQLEATLGLGLFEPTSHGVRPTREAERLARQIRLAAVELEQARAEVAAALGAGSGRTVIGALPLARSGLVPAAVLAFASRRPQHSVSILDGPYESLLAALRGGRADVLCGALRDEVSTDVRQEHLFDDPLAIVVRAGHPLASRPSGGRRRSQQQLAIYPWIAPRPGSPLRRHFEALQAALGPSAGPAPIECNSLSASRALLLASDRAMLLSAHQVRHELAAGQLAVLPHPFGTVTRAIGLSVRRDWHPTAVQCELVDALRAAALDASVSARPSALRNRPARGTRAARDPSTA